jgi:hypothetical protein
MTRMKKRREEIINYSRFLVQIIIDRIQLVYALEKFIEKMLQGRCLFTMTPSILGLFIYLYIYILDILGIYWKLVFCFCKTDF